MIRSLRLLRKRSGFVRWVKHTYLHHSRGSPIFILLCLAACPQKARHRRRRLRRMAFREIDNRIIVLLERVKINLISYSYTLDSGGGLGERGRLKMLKWQYEHNNNNNNNNKGRSVDEDIVVALGFLGQTSNEQRSDPKWPGGHEGESEK